MSCAQSVIVSLAEGQRLADLVGIANDLRACEDYIKLHSGLSAVQPSLLNHQLLDCVMTTIVIRYGRCFGRSVREATHKELKSTMTPKDLDVHNLIVALRNKHYAHSENSCELPAINVWLTADGTEKMATSVSVGAHYISGDDPVILHNLSVLVNKLLTWAIDEEKKESLRLLPLVLKKYSVEDLYGLIGKTTRQQVTFGDLSKRRPGV